MAFNLSPENKRAETISPKTAELPRHIAIIMDGNGRWAQNRGQNRSAGHYQGTVAAQKILEQCSDLGIEVLTLFAFSTENWLRPKEEVSILLKILCEFINKEIKNMHKRNIKIKFIGQKNRFPGSVRKVLDYALDLTKNNSGLQLNVALSYGSRWEITDSVREIALRVKKGEVQPEDITEDMINNHLLTNGQPEPDLLIRTSGEKRVSNFLLWQIAYTEFYFVDKFWPDFGEEDLLVAINEFAQRQRRYGKVQ